MKRVPKMLPFHLSLSTEIFLSFQRALGNGLALEVVLPVCLGIPDRDLCSRIGAKGATYDFAGAGKDARTGKRKSDMEFQESVNSQMEFGNKKTHQSTIIILQSEIRNRQSAIINPQSSIRNHHSAIANPKSAIRHPQSAIYNQERTH